MPGALEGALIYPLKATIFPAKTSQPQFSPQMISAAHSLPNLPKSCWETQNDANDSADSHSLSSYDEDSDTHWVGSSDDEKPPGGAQTGAWGKSACAVRAPSHSLTALDTMDRSAKLPFLDERRAKMAGKRFLAALIKRKRHLNMQKVGAYSG